MTPQTVVHTIPASAVNPDAGSHPVTADPREIDAARRAAEASLREFPYFRARFGDRALAFGASDGGWLATLCDAGAERARTEVLWLGRVLASRGMPRLLLERHLELLHDELARAVPERAERYRVLRDVAAHLRELRRARLSDAELAELSAAFDARVGPALAERVPAMGAVLAAAAADEADGLAGAVRSVEEWAADPDAFGSRWVEAVRATVAEARARLRPG
ncbi:MAG TPA: hypothetical protein VHG51_03840 [Longimicrobiaceae bacterium]|nr:hypothetical protein [Longimicrobiaceae bacterium]